MLTGARDPGERLRQDFRRIEHARDPLEPGRDGPRGEADVGRHDFDRAAERRGLGHRRGACSGLVAAMGAEMPARQPGGVLNYDEAIVYNVGREPFFLSRETDHAVQNDAIRPTFLIIYD
jgi:hypothetical protein